MRNPEYLKLLCHGDILINLLGRGDILVVNVALLPDAELPARCAYCWHSCCSLWKLPPPLVSWEGGWAQAILGDAVTTEQSRPQVSEHNCFHLCHLNIALSLKTVFVPSAPAHHAWPGSGQGPSRLVNTCWDHKICSERSYILTEREAPLKLSS